VFVTVVVPLDDAAVVDVFVLLLPAAPLVDVDDDDEVLVLPPLPAAEPVLSSYVASAPPQAEQSQPSAAARAAPFVERVSCTIC
jgi:hypothetical protein